MKRNRIRGIMLFAAACSLFTVFLLTGCIGDKANPVLVSKGIKDKSMQRIAITSSRYAGRYTIIDRKAIENFTKIILNATDVQKNSYLEPDFILEFYSDDNNIINFKYIAGISDTEVANLIDPDGRMYHVSSSIENEFLKRLVKGSDSENIPEYYISLIRLLIGKTAVKSGETVVVDISKDYVVTRSITSVELKKIIDSIDSNAKIKFPSETKVYNHIIKINTSKYTDQTTNADISISDSKGKTQYYEIVGTYENGDWNYHIKYK